MKTDDWINCDLFWDNQAYSKQNPHPKSPSNPSKDELDKWYKEYKDWEKLANLNSFIGLKLDKPRTWIKVKCPDSDSIKILLIGDDAFQGCCGIQLDQDSKVLGYKPVAEES